MGDFKGIYRRAGSDIYLTSIRRFDHAAGKWKWVKLSTHTTDPVKALKTREELQALENEHAKHADSFLTREKAFEVVNNLLRWHGVPEITDDSRSEMTLGKFADPWLEDLKKTGTLPMWRMANSHLRHFRKRLGDDCLLRAITKRQIQDWYNDLAGSGRKPKTVNAYLKTIRRFFRDAIDEDFIMKSPALRIRTVSGKARKKDPFTIAEIESLFRVAGEREFAEEWEIAILFGLCLGARLNDCTIRRWEEIEISGKIPHINYSPSKTDRHSTVVKAPLVDPLLSKLRAAVRSDSGFVTPNLAKIPASGRGNLSPMFKEMMDDAEVDYHTEEGEGKGIAWASKSFHSFRHTLPSLMAQANVPEQVRMGIVGHTRLETHLGYTHHDDQQMRGALESSLASVAGI